MTIDRDQLDALILAGGRGRRMGGVDKTQLVVDGATIAARQLAVLSPLVADVIVSAAAPLAWTGGLRIVLDEPAHRDAGPLAGVAAGLRVSRAWLLVVAGDLPDLDGAVLDLLIGAASDELDAVACRIDGRPEPLCALYRQTCLVRIQARLAAGDYRVSGVLEDAALRVAWIDEARVREVDLEARTFRNVNRPEPLMPYLSLDRGLGVGLGLSLDLGLAPRPGPHPAR